MILVTGGTGFVGPKIVHALRAQERDVRCLVRKPGRAGTLKAWGCELVQGDVTDAESMRRAAEGCEAVVHLVAIITGSPADFDRVMNGGTQNAVAAARAAGVRRFVLMSALGVSEQTRTLVPYYEAKWAMEEAVRDSGIEHVVFRPSFVFGRDGGVLAALRPAGSLVAGHARARAAASGGSSRSGSRTSPRTSRVRSTCRRRRTGPSTSSAPTG